MIGLSALQDREKDLLIAWFMYYMPQGDDNGTPDATKATRGEFRKQYPDIYNRLRIQRREVTG